MFQRVFAKVSVTAATLLLLAAPPARAQENCQSFRAVMPMTFDMNAGWSGSVYAVLGTEVLVGKWATEVAPQTTCDAVACQDTGGRSLIDFGGKGLMKAGDTLTVELQSAQYAIPDGYATYHAMWKVTGGTGRFEQATGMAFESGPFVAWMDSSDVPQGSYTGVVDGGICGARPVATAAATAFGKPAASFRPAFPFALRQLSPSARK